MSLFGNAITWLTDGANWQGANGIVHLTVGHLEVTGASMLLAAAVALPLGIGAGHRRKGGRLISIVGNAGRAIPTLALIILLAGQPSFGVTTRTAVVALAVFAVPPMLINAYTGVRQVDPDALDAARGLGMNGPQLLTRVEVPLALPLIATGVRIAVLQTFATATIAAFVGTRTLGTIIQINQATNQEQAVLGAAFVIAAEALVLDTILAWIQSVMRPGPRRRRARLGESRPALDTVAAETELAHG